MLPEVHVGQTREVLDWLAADFWAEAARTLAERASFSVALPGGSVALQCFRVLAGLSIDWRRVHFFWVDERAVPASDPESNYAVAKALWFDPAKVPIESIHRMPADDPDLERAAAAYSGELTRTLGSPPCIDYLLLGVGPDGHVASLFPDRPAVAADERWVAPVMDAPKPPPARLTLTMAALVGAERLVVVAFGASKAQALANAVERPGSPLPLSVALQRSKRPLVLADQAAGALMAVPRQGSLRGID